MGVCLICSAVVGAWPARVTPRLRRPARVTPRLRRPARVTPRLRRPARVTPRLRRPARVTPRLRRPARVTPRLRRPARVTPRLRRPARVTPRLRRPARVTPRLRRPARVTPRLRRPARVTPRLRRPARVTPRLRRPARVTSRLRRPARVTSRLRRPARVTSRPCCLVRPALVGSCLIGPTWTWPSVPSPGSTSAPPPSWILLCVSVWKPLLGGGALSWIWFPLTQTAHHPWTTFPIMHCTHTFPSTITPITQLSPFTHQLWLPHHTCTSFSHSHKSSTQTLTQCEVLFSPGYISERSPIHPAISVFHPGLPDLGSLNLCLWPRLLPGIVYVSALPLIFLFLPADLACLILPIKYCCKWIHSPLTIPYSMNLWWNTDNVFNLHLTK